MLADLLELLGDPCSPRRGEGEEEGEEEEVEGDEEEVEGDIEDSAVRIEFTHLANLLLVFGYSEAKRARC